MRITFADFIHVSIFSFVIFPSHFFCSRPFFVLPNVHVLCTMCEVPVHVSFYVCFLFFCIFRGFYRNSLFNKTLCFAIFLCERCFYGVPNMLSCIPFHLRSIFLHSVEYFFFRTRSRFWIILLLKHTHNVWMDL